MNIKNQRLCAWGGVASNLIFFTGLLPLAHLFPPTPPSWNAQQVAGFYLDHSLGIRLGCVLMMIAVSLFIPFFCAISVQMKRIEGDFAPMAYTQMLAGGIGLVPVFIGITLWAVAAFRPEQPPEIIRMLSDFAWIGLIFAVPPPMVQLIALGLAILQNEGAEPVFPRWLAFFNFWCTVLGAAGMAVIFFKTGPFAWNGFFGFYLSASIFAGVWVFVMTWQLLKAIRRQEVLGVAFAASPTR